MTLRQQLRELPRDITCAFGATQHTREAWAREAQAFFAPPTPQHDWSKATVSDLPRAVEQRSAEGKALRADDEQTLQADYELVQRLFPVGSAVVSLFGEATVTRHDRRRVFYTYRESARAKGAPSGMMEFWRDFAAFEACNYDGKEWAPC